MLKELLRPADAHMETNLKKGMLKRRYRLLLDIIQTVIVGITFSKDGLSTQKIRILFALIDKSKNINWVQMLKNRLNEELKKFYENIKHKKIDLKKTINLVRKVSILLQEHMALTRWEAIDIKPFVYSRKALLTSTTTIFGSSDKDMEPTVAKPKAKPAGQKRKATSVV